MNISAGTVARTLCLVIALVNQVLAVLGRDALPFAEDEVYQLTSLVFTIGTAAAAWWRNNSFTKAAIKADNYMEEVKKTYGNRN